MKQSQTLHLSLSIPQGFNKLFFEDWDDLVEYESDILGSINFIYNFLIISSNKS